MRQEEGVAGDGLAGVGAGSAAIQQGQDPFRRLLSAADLQQRPDDGADHVPKKAVRTHAKQQVIALLRRIMEQGDMRGRVGGPLRESHRAEG